MFIFTSFVVNVAVTFDIFVLLQASDGIQFLYVPKIRGALNEGRVKLHATQHLLRDSVEASLDSRESCINVDLAFASGNARF